MKLVNDTRENVAIPLKDGTYAELGPGEEKSIGNVNTEHQRFKGYLHANVIRDPEAKQSDASRSATATVGEKK